MMIDTVRENKERFAAWALEWVTVPSQFFVNGLIRYEELIIERLIEMGTFTARELLCEFKNHKIYGYSRLLKKFDK